MRRISVVGLVAAALLALSATSAAGGGTWMEPTKDRYEPGDEVTAVGFVGVEAGEETPLTAFFVMVPATRTVADPAMVEVGPVTVEPTGLDSYLRTRVSITFVIPQVSEPGWYQVIVKNQRGDFFGDLIGPGINVGLDPEHPRWIEWPLDEPLIAELEDEAIISGPGFAVSVADLRAGRYPAGAENFMLDPSVLLRPGVVSEVLEPPPEMTSPPPTLPVTEPAAAQAVEAPPLLENERPAATTPVANPDSQTSDESGATPLVVIAAVAILVLGYALFPSRRRSEPLLEEIPEDESILVDTR